MTAERLPILLSNVSAVRQPVGGPKVDSLSTIEASVEARMVGIGKGDDEGAFLMHQPVHRHTTRLRNSTYTC